MVDQRKKLVSLLFNSGRKMRDYFHGNKDGHHSMLNLETLRFIKENENAPMKDLASFLCITPASTSSLIDGLAKEKLVDRIEEKKDRRIIRLKITPKGRKLLEKEFKKMTDQLHTLFNRLDDEDVKHFIKILEKFTTR